jgi:hypothetical protein
LLLVSSSNLLWSWQADLNGLHPGASFPSGFALDLVHGEPRKESEIGLLIPLAPFRNDFSDLRPQLLFCDFYIALPLTPFTISFPFLFPLGLEVIMVALHCPHVIQFKCAICFLLSPGSGIGIIQRSNLVPLLQSHPYPALFCLEIGLTCKSAYRVRTNWSC